MVEVANKIYMEYMMAVFKKSYYLVGWCCLVFFIISKKAFYQAEVFHHVQIYLMIYRLGMEKAVGMNKSVFFID